MKRFLKSSALVALAAVLPWSAKAVYTIPKFRLNQYYDSNAVLQRGVTLPICGTAAFGGTVSVTFNGLTKTATANIETAWTEEGGEGRWTVDFPAMEAGGPYTLTVTDGTKTLTATNILIGDVWHLAGQSNSYYPIERFTDDADEWLKDADYPEVRFIEPTSAVTGHLPHLLNQDYWYPLSSATAGKCSALGFFFVKELRKTVNVPMGIVNSAADGTTIAKWLPSTTERNGYATKIVNDFEPLAPFPVKGVIWYQGESDGMFSNTRYRYDLQNLIRQWRTVWEDADMPFLIPQLPFYGQYDDKWGQIRLAQNWAAAQEANVHVVSTLDIGDLEAIHPRKKPELGARLSLFARRYIYGETDIYPDGPVYKSCEVNPSDASELLVHFNVHGSIMSRDGQALKGFKVGGMRGGSRQYYDGTVRIVNGTTLGVKNANVASPDSVRYGCHNLEPTTINFFDNAGNPARAFSSEEEAGGGDDDDDDDDDPDHVHGWKFTLSGSVLTAVCTNDSCTAGTPTLSISGGDTKSYDGSPLKVSLTGDDLAARTVSQIGPIEYYQNDEKLSGAPTAVGVYEARVQVIHDSDIYVLKKTLTIAEAEVTLQSRIDAAVPGGTVELGEGTFVINAQLNVTGGVRLVGAGWDKTTISPDSGLKIRCVYVDGGATVEGMTLTGGNADLGSGAWIKNGTVSWCKLINNSASVANCHGVGVSFTEGQGQVDHCIIAGNSGWVGTSGIGIGATGPTGAITIDTCLVYGNKTWTSTGSGAAIGIYNHDFDCTVRNCTIVGNTANLYGAVYRQSGTGKLILLNDIVAGNFLFNGTEANVKNATANETKNCLFGLASEIQTGMTDCLSGDPVFVGDGDYRLQASSPAKGAGLSGAGTKDLDNKNFANTPSIGCYEAGEPVPAHDHVWGEASYDWSDDFFTCAAAADCTVAGCSVTTGETVTAEYAVTKEATEEESGTGLYTATFTSPLFVQQSKEVVIPKLEPHVDPDPSGITPGATASETRKTIQDAIDAAALESPAGTVTLGEGVFQIDAQLNVTGGVKLVGQGRAKTFIEPASGASIRCVFVDGEATVESVTLRNGAIDDNGGGVSLVSGAVRDCCISNCQTVTGQRWGGGVYMTGGAVEDCLIVDCKVMSGHYQWGGGGICMEGGRVVRCEITGCQAAGTYGHANALYMRGGVADGCDIHHNDGGNGGNVDWNSSVVLLYKGGTLQNSKIHHNTRSNVPGVKIENSGTVRNCLIYNNVIPDQNTYTFDGGALYLKNGGTVEYCTIYGNVVSRTNQGQSALFCSGGTVRNSIFWGNGPAGWTDATCTVSGSPTIANNVFDIVPDGYSTGNAAGDPLFTNAASGDFTIASDRSPACGFAVPIEGVTTDIAGVTRSATAPTCGAYEFGAEPPTPAWDIPGTKGGINGLDDGKGGKQIRVTSFSVVDGQLAVGFEARKVDADGETFALVCKENLTDTETFTIEVTLTNGATDTLGSLAGTTGRSSLFVLGIGAAQ